MSYKNHSGLYGDEPSLIETAGTTTVITVIIALQLFFMVGMPESGMAPVIASSIVIFFYSVGVIANVLYKGMACAVLSCVGGIGTGVLCVLLHGISLEFSSTCQLSFACAVSVFLSASHIWYFRTVRKNVFMSVLAGISVFCILIGYLLRIVL